MKSTCAWQILSSRAVSNPQKMVESGNHHSVTARVVGVHQLQLRLENLAMFFSAPKNDNTPGLVKLELANGQLNMPLVRIITYPRHVAKTWELRSAQFDGLMSATADKLILITGPDWSAERSSAINGLIYSLRRRH